MSAEKKLREGEARYIAKKLEKRWGVYDRAQGSWPVLKVPPYGPVKQDMRTEDEAQTEADRLNAIDLEF